MAKAKTAFLTVLGICLAILGVIGLVVHTGSLVIRVPNGGRGEVPVNGYLITVLETYRRGPIKVTRERSWTRAAEETAPDVRAALERQSAELRAEFGD